MRQRDEDRNTIEKGRIIIKENQFHIKELMRERDEDRNTIEKGRKIIKENQFHIKELMRQRDEDRKIINELNRQRNEDKKKLHFHEIRINGLLLKNKELEDEVKSLSNFAFSAKIRKLLKKLLEFLIDQYFQSYMIYDENSKKVKFVFPPKHISGQSDIKIKFALNRIIDIIFNESKHSDHVVHLVDEKVKNDIRYYKKIKVFRNARDFLAYFGLLDYEDIILDIIPEEYLTTIDNWDFERQIGEMMKSVNRK